jgi:uncharacterized protein (DUF1697 family)
MSYVALLRAINVAGKNKLAMNALRTLLTDLGGQDVRTYLQSGNAVFSHPATDPEQLATEVETRLADFGVPARALVRTGDELAEVLSGSPFAAQEPDLTKLHVTFLAEVPAPERAERLQVPAGDTGVFALCGKHIYLHLPDGYGRTKLNNAYLENRLGTVATTRSWRTVAALAELTDSPTPG